MDAEFFEMLMLAHDLGMLAKAHATFAGELGQKKWKFVEAAGRKSGNNTATAHNLTRNRIMETTFKVQFLSDAAIKPCASIGPIPLGQILRTRAFGLT